MKHVILSESKNGSGMFARVCRKPTGSYSIELGHYDWKGDLIIQTITTEGHGLSLLRDALAASFEPELDLIAKEGGEAERQWLQTLSAEDRNYINGLTKR
jgi:hypothetical protein